MGCPEIVRQENACIKQYLACSNCGEPVQVSSRNERMIYVVPCECIITNQLYSHEDE